MRNGGKKMNIDFNELKDTNIQKIYRHLWENNSFSAGVVSSGNSNHSYEFEFAGKTLIDYVAESLADYFEIMDLEPFKEKFRMACSGTGDELKKITTLHSSSLCALLFFFNVTPPFVIKGLENYEFTESLFEFKNKVIGYPSNIDIVLLGKNIETKGNVILFLESKFSEYITGINKKNSNYEIGKSYFYKKNTCYSEPIYRKLLDKKIIYYRESKNKCYLYADSDKYIEGLKQMNSHYYGIRNFLKGEYYKKDNENLEKLKNYKADEYILGEILFDNFGKELKDYLNSYESDYEKLAEIINDQYKIDVNDSKFRVLKKTLHYSDLKDYFDKSSKIRQYYFYK